MIFCVIFGLLWMNWWISSVIKIFTYLHQYLSSLLYLLLFFHFSLPPLNLPLSNWSVHCNFLQFTVASHDKISNLNILVCRDAWQLLFIVEVWFAFMVNIFVPSVAWKLRLTSEICNSYFPQWDFYYLLEHLTVHAWF